MNLVHIVDSAAEPLKKFYEIPWLPLNDIDLKISLTKNAKEYVETLLIYGKIAVNGSRWHYWKDKQIFWDYIGHRLWEIYLEDLW